MRVLVTGATGFIGKYVIEELLKNNIEVIATSENNSKVKSFSWFDQVEFIEFDMNLASTYEGNLIKQFKYPDKLIHLAWSNLPNYNELFHYENNLFNNYFFLKKLIEDGLNDLTVSGTCFEYGMKNGCLVESMIPEPSNSYAVAKDTLRKFLQQLQNKKGFLLKWVRLFYIYGKGQSEKSLYSLLEKAVENSDKEFRMSPGDQIRDYLSVEDVAKNLTAISLQNEVTGIINCSSGIPISVKRFVEEYFTGKKKKVDLITGYYPYPEYEPFAFWGDCKKLNSIKK